MVNTWNETLVQRWINDGCPEVDVYGIDLNDPSEEIIQSLEQNIDKFRDLTSFTISGTLRAPIAFPPTLRRLVLYNMEISEFPHEFHLDRHRA
jgi:hypothetical protein